MSKIKLLALSGLLFGGFYFYKNLNVTKKEKTNQSVRTKDIKRVFSKNSQTVKKKENVSTAVSDNAKTQELSQNREQESHDKVSEAIKNGSKNRDQYKKLQ